MDFSTYTGLRFERKPAGVLLITIDHHPEKYNPLDEQLHHDLGRVWLDIDADPETRVAVITGAGKAFSAGGDIEWEKNCVGNYGEVAIQMKAARAIVVNLASCDKPIISAINGPAAGGGLAVALMADISIMAAEAKVTDGHMRIGLAAGDHAALLWPLLCGMAKAKYYLLTADMIDGVEAERIGLVSKCVPRAEVLNEALALADRLANSPQTSLQWTKRSLNQWLLSALPIFDLSLAYEMLNWFGPDLPEGIAAFSEKRAPRFPSAGNPGLERGVA